MHNLHEKCYRKPDASEQFDIVESVAHIQQNFRERYERVSSQAALLQEALDQERKRFAVELQELSGQLQAQIKRNELLSTKIFALEQENRMLSEQVRGVERNYQEVQSQIMPFGEIQQSLRERLESRREADRLQMSELQQVRSLKEAEMISARCQRSQLTYTKAEDV